MTIWLCEPLTSSFRMSRTQSRVLRSAGCASNGGERQSQALTRYICFDTRQRPVSLTFYQDKPIPHPTVQALYAAHKRKKISTYHLNRLIESKERNLLSPEYNTLSDLTSYAQSTSLSMLLLQLALLVPPSERKIDDIPLSTIDHSLSHLAVYITIAQLLRSIPFFASKRALVLPRDVASAHGIVDEALFRALPSLSQEKGLQQRPQTDSPEDENIFQPIIQACDELLALAELERSKARWTLGLEASGDDEHAALAQGRSISRLPKAIAPVFLSAVPAKSFFHQFVGAGGNPFHPSIRVNTNRNWKLPFQTWWASTRGQF